MSSYKIKPVTEKEIVQETTIDGKSYPATMFKSCSLQRPTPKPPKLNMFSKSKTSPEVDIDGPSEPAVKSRVVLLSKGEGWSLKLPKHYKYRVVFIQDTGDDKVLYELFAANEYSATKEAFNLINKALSPLTEDGDFFIPKQLLKHVMLPEPLLPSMLGPRLVEIMEKEPGVHSDWYNIIDKLNDAEKKKSESQDKFDETGSLSSLKRIVQNVKRPSSSDVMLSVTPSSSSRLSVDLSACAPLIAVPTAASKLTDDETSDEVWSLFRKGTLRARNESEKSKVWLIEETEKGYVKSALKLILSSEVNINERHPRTGDTALHVAIRAGNVSLVKLFLAHQADLTITNRKKETPYDVAKKIDGANASIIKELVETTKKLTVKSTSYFARNSKAPRKRGSSDTFLLSLDGGGMRSVIMCHILSAIERRMKELTSDSCKPLQSYFDYIAGTSAGAIIGGLLLYSNISVSFSGMYLYKFMVDVFCCPKTDRIKKLKGFLTDIVGESTTMSQPKSPANNLIVTTTIANVSPNKLHLMTSYGEPRDNQLGPRDRKVWEALVASAAAPTYFPAYQSFLDGGLMANNPTLPAMTDILRQGELKQRKTKIGCVLSLGTGCVSPQTVDNFEVYVPGFTVDVAKKMFQSSMGLVSLLSHFVEQTTQSNGEVVQQAEMWSKSIGANYLRLSPPLSEDIPPDFKSIDKFISLLYETELYILEQHESIDNIAKIIIAK